MYYDRELSMMQNYHDELLNDVQVYGRAMTSTEFKRACAKVWASDEIISIIAKEDGSINVLLHNDAPYSVAMLVQCFMLDMEYCIRMCQNIETITVWESAYGVGLEILERLKAM